MGGRQMQFSILLKALLELISNMFIWKCIMNTNTVDRFVIPKLILARAHRCYVAYNTPQKL